MSTIIELQRYILEEIDTIEEAISKRLERNSDLLPESDRPVDFVRLTKKRPFKELLLQEHELKFLKGKYIKDCQSILKNRDDDKKLFIKELERITDPVYDMAQFDASVKEIQDKHNQYKETNLVEDTRKLFSMFSSAPEEGRQIKKNKLKVQRRYIVSAAASHIDLNDIYTTEEENGKCIDLNEFYNEFLEVLGLKATYIEYLGFFDKFPYEGSTKSNEYSEYLKKLKSYLVNFILRAQPLRNIHQLLKDIETKYGGEIVNSQQDGIPNEQGEVYCKACDKVFNKLTVYNGHLQGKKHTKNQKKLQDGKQESSSIIESISKNEFIINELGKVLEKVKDNTISNYERRNTMTDNERRIEIMAHNDQDSDYTTADTSDDNDGNSLSSDNDDNEKSLPLGIDGRPIPFWLYKLQGLNQSYSCEICGNIAYKGRSSYSKHFSGSKHQNGLLFLGIPEDSMSLFKDINKIEEAKELWRKLKKEKRIKEVDTENAIEVEDDQGNVMSEKDYLELKKQGLL